MRLADARFTIASNGFVDCPAQALRDFLVERGAGQVVTVFHPLLSEDEGVHEITLWTHGTQRWRRQRALPHHPPLTYPIDLAIPLRPPATDYWFGFNCLAAFRGLAERAMNRAGKVVYWGIDFVEDRFGHGVITRAYEWLDGLCCSQADAWFDLSEAALLARRNRHRGKRLAPSRVAPIGVWLDRLPTTSENAISHRRLVFLGHLVPRQGAGLVIDTVRLITSAGEKVSADIIGRGPELESLKAHAAELGLSDLIHFHGYVPDHRDLEKLLATASLALAPYVPDPGSFTAFADASKLKSYLAAGLPILMTGVPPNAEELAKAGAASVLPFYAAAFASEAVRLLGSPDEWSRRRSTAIRLARAYDWGQILASVLTDVGVDCS